MEKIALSQESYAKLLDAERGLTAVVSELDTAEKCGIECQNYRASLQAQLATIANLKAHYTPKV